MAKKIAQINQQNSALCIESVARSVDNRWLAANAKGGKISLWDVQAFTFIAVIFKFSKHLAKGAV